MRRQFIIRGGDMSSKHLRGVNPAHGTVIDALIKAPPAPFYPSSQAKAEWKRIMAQLINRRILRFDRWGAEKRRLSVRHKFNHFVELRLV